MRSILLFFFFFFWKLLEIGDNFGTIFSIKFFSRGGSANFTNAFNYLIS